MTDSSEFRTITQINQATREGVEPAKLQVQIESIRKKESSNGKPYWELKLRDHDSALTLRAWSDTDAFFVCENLKDKDCVEITADFYQNGSFGIDAKRWQIAPLTEERTASFLVGSEEMRQAIEINYDFICTQISEVKDPRLKRIGETFLEEFGERFKRTAAARAYHHAYRGGLCAHCAQMMRSALALCQVYTELNQDLIITGILFHDSGKLWETCPDKNDLVIQRELFGEMLGHISIGIEFVNKAWGKLDSEKAAWSKLQPPSEQVRIHLLHLVASHHGELQYGSPIEPKIPEAVALHYIDNLDARLQMFAENYEKSPLLAPQIYERRPPLKVSPIAPLKKFSSEAEEQNPQVKENSTQTLDSQ
ncbi:MAG: HD domain-containing protein [Chthoniobacterales bacterium]